MFNKTISEITKELETDIVSGLDEVKVKERQ